MLKTEDHVHTSHQPTEREGSIKMEDFLKARNFAVNLDKSSNTHFAKFPSIYCSIIVVIQPD